MCCWHQLPSGLSRHAERSWGRSPSDRPAARQPTRELMSTTHTYPWLIPIITWCWQFPSLSTDILLIKSKSKLKSRAIVAGVPCHHVILVASIAVAPTPGGESACASFFPGSRVCQSNCIRVASFLGDNIVDHHVVCLKAEFLWHTVLSNENDEFYTYDIYLYLNRSVSGYVF